MTFRIIQKINNKEYVYDVTKYWDPITKKSKQKRQYIGVKQKDDTITTPHKTINIKHIRDFGAVYLLEYFAKKSKLKQIIKKVFPKDYINILNLIYFKIIEHSPYYLFQDWAEGSHLYEGEPLISQELSEFTKELGGDVDSQKDFFKEWVKEHQELETLIFDITSISSHSKYNDWLEWGYNRDHENLPQINIGAIISQELGIPLAYRFCPGSIPDVATLKNTTLFALDIGIKKIKFVMDKGFFSEKNVKSLIDNSLEFTMPLSFSTSESQRLLKKTEEDLKKASNSFHHEQDLMYYAKENIIIAEHALVAHVYLNATRQKEQVSNFLLKLTRFEEDVLEDSKTEEELIKKTKKNTYGKFFTVIGNELVRNDSIIDEHLLDKGKIILIANHEISKKELLDMYVNKDIVEKYFDTMKNELDEKRLKVSSREVFSGRLFITFLSLILRTYLSNLSNKAKLNKTYTIPEVLTKLNLIRKVTTDKKRYYLTEISKNQRFIFEKLGVPLPT